MAKLLKLRRGTTSQHSSFTGAEGEVTVDTTKDTVVVHDGSTAGGIPLAKESAAYTHPNHSGEVTSSADGAQTIADNVVDEANLKVSNSPTNGQYLQAQSGNTGGLTWAAVPAGVGGATGLDLNDDVKIRLGDSNEFELYYDSSSNLHLKSNHYVRVASDAGLWVWDNAESNWIAGFDPGGSCKLRDSGYTTRLETTTSGVTITGTATATTFSGSGASLTSLPAANLTGTLPAISGANLTSLNASNISSGTISSSRIPTLNQNTTGTSGGFTAGNASNLNSGTVNVARLGSGASSSKFLRGDNTWQAAGVSADSNNNVSFAGGPSLTGSANYNFFAGPEVANSFANANSGDSNLGIGYRALYNMPAGLQNVVAIGNSALYALNNTSASKNTAVGRSAGRYITTGGGNTCLGNAAGHHLTTGSNNIAIGDSAFTDFSISAGMTGSQNIGIGYKVGGRIASGWDNILIGNESTGDAITGGNGNICIGSSAGSTIAWVDDNICIGRSAGTNLTGSQNILIGQGASPSSNSITNEITLGNSNITKFRIPGIGLTIKDSTPGQHKILVCDSSNEVSFSDLEIRTSHLIGPEISGYSSGGTTGSTVLGTDAKQVSASTIIGWEAGKNLSGDHGSNIYIGSRCGSTNTSNSSGAGYNCCVGNDFGLWLSSGKYNSTLGYRAGISVQSGMHNTLVGYEAGYGVTTGDYNLCLGANAGKYASPSGYITTGNNNVVLGDDNIDNLYCFDTSISSSDKRDKTDITDFTHGLKWIEQLKPVTYRWDKRSWYNEYNEDGSIKTEGTSDGSKKRTKQHIGFLAQDVLAIEQADGFASKKDDMLVVNLNEDDTAYGLKYERLVPVLVNAVKELSAKVTALEAK